MKKHILFLFLFMFIAIQLHSQNILVIDSLTQKPIPYITVRYNENDGTYTDEKGYFTVNNKSNDSVMLSHIAYNNYSIKAALIKDTIIMSPKTKPLHEIIITNANSVKHIDFLKKNFNHGSFPISSRVELVTLIIPGTENANAMITKLELRFEKKRFEKTEKDIKTLFRINIYTVQQEQIHDKIFTSAVYNRNSLKQEKVELDLTDSDIQLSENGLFIGIEVIGDVAVNGTLTANNNSVRPLLTDRTTNDYTAKTFLRYTFDGKKKLQPLNTVLENNVDPKTKRNLSFGLTLTK